MTEETAGERRFRVGLRRSGIDQHIRDAFNPEGEWDHIEENEGAVGLLGYALDAGELLPDTVYALLEKAWDQGWKQHAYIQQHGVGVTPASGMGNPHV